MIYIKHRVNDLRELKDLDKSWGAEIDLRSDVNAPGKIHLSHDPWTRGGDFERWLEEWNKQEVKGPIVLNTKEDGLEDRTLALLKSHGIDSFFFLDTQIPTLVRHTENGETRFAIRCSSVEPVSFAEGFVDRTRWLWLDCFGGSPEPTGNAERLSKTFRLCLVSPELQGRLIDEISNFEGLLKYSHAICTKRPEKWMNLRGA